MKYEDIVGKEVERAEYLGRVNEEIKHLSGLSLIDTNDVSDGYHTFGELYEHRCTLWVALCGMVSQGFRERVKKEEVWRSRVNSDGSKWEGWFLLGMFTDAGKQISYYLPEGMWEMCGYAKEMEKAPEFDGHTSKDVIKRINKL
jgi:hypothetical protein